MSTNTSQPRMEEMMTMKFSKEDMRILQECNKESFYKRCLPISGLFGFATYSAIKAGYLTTGKRYGAFPKVSFAVAMGFILGKLSYRSICAEKLMNSPDSEVGAILRKRLNRPSFDNFEKKPSDLPFVSSSNQDNIAPAKSALDLDMDSRPSFAPSEDSSFASSRDSINQPNDVLSPITPTMSYDDMRRQNRESFSQRRVQPYKLEETPRQKKVEAERETKNKYGDVID